MNAEITIYYDEYDQEWRAFLSHLGHPGEEILLPIPTKKGADAAIDRAIKYFDEAYGFSIHRDDIVPVDEAKFVWKEVEQGLFAWYLFDQLETPLTPPIVQTAANEFRSLSWHERQKYAKSLSQNYEEFAQAYDVSFDV